MPALQGKTRDHTFQDQPAISHATQTRYQWVWVLYFTRDGVPYSITLTQQIEEDIEKSAWWKFLHTFRVEPVIEATTEPTTQLTLPDVVR